MNNNSNHIDVTELMSSENGLSRRDLLKLIAAVAVVGVASPTRAGDSAGKPTLAIVSRHLQWTDWRTGIEVAKEAGYAGIMWTVRSGAHITPENVRQELPRVVEETRKAGLSVPMIITQINGSRTPHVEAMLETFGSLGIRIYRAGAPRYDYSRDFSSQYAEISENMKGLAELNTRFDVGASFHTHSSPGSVGGSLWDLWMVMRDIDPQRIGINFDVGHVTARSPSGWFDAAVAARAHIRSLTLKDVHWARVKREDPNEWPWNREFLPPGNGMVNFRQLFTFLKDTNFTGPLGVYHEYLAEIPGTSNYFDMLGTSYGNWELEVSRDHFVSLLRRDVEFYRAAARDVGLVI